VAIKVKVWKNVADAFDKWPGQVAMGVGHPIRPWPPSPGQEATMCICLVYISSNKCRDRWPL